VSEDDHLTLNRFSNEAARQVLAPPVIQRRDGIVKDDPVSMISETQLRQEGSERNRPLFAFAEDVVKLGAGR
jgi:hypothetical protein